MIVRIATEGQYTIDDDAVDELNELDKAAVTTCDSGDETAFHDTYAQLLEFVRRRGHAVDDDHLSGSDLILPPPDVTLEEARAEFSAEGLIPD